ncbi:16S rRNA pseudouridine(516) synthase [Desemzia sp. RIT804]|uniref:16S rRNA pseudouridine(516) synthase n=1 Tax=Desemzia sp. RIT 804 TaxID=2810209 RepID=UPI0019503737|nr:16S rRNA pseudouridine(516) synthase [Desemzia sp. RIT 804]MBM6615570.1 16S rRNA pseudouridine(516) synthase [Desemzia sp. RIT 804]
MRLDKLLGEVGFGSRKTVKRLINSKQVVVDGKVVMEDNVNVDPQIQEVFVLQKKIYYQPHAYYMMNKPGGVVSAVQDKKNETVIDLIKESDRFPGLYPVGRLDKDTEGLLLITNNGNLGYQLLLPHKHVAKKYEVIVNERVTNTDREAFAEGVTFHGGIKCKPAKLTILESSDLESRVIVEISEGKFHQVKKMFLACGKKVTYLKRLSMGPIELDGNLSAGAYRPLTIEELNQLTPYF